LAFYCKFRKNKEKSEAEGDFLQPYIKLNVSIAMKSIVQLNYRSADGVALTGAASAEELMK